MCLVLKSRTAWQSNLPSGNQTWQLKGLYLFDDLIAVSEGKCYSAIWRCNCPFASTVLDRCCGWEWLAPSDGTHVHIFVGPWLATVRVCGTCENPCPRPAGGAQVCTLTLIRGPRGEKDVFVFFESVNQQEWRYPIYYIFLYGIPLHAQFLDWRAENPLGISLLQSSRGVTWVAPEGTRKKWQAGHIDCWDCRYCSNPHPPNVNPARKAIILLHSNLILGRWDS